MFLIEVAERKKIEIEIERKNKILAEQRISGFEAQRMNSERTALRSSLSHSEKELSNIVKQLLDTEKQLQMRQEEVYIDWFMM